MQINLNGRIESERSGGPITLKNAVSANTIPLLWVKPEHLRNKQINRKFATYTNGVKYISFLNSWIDFIGIPSWKSLSSQKCAPNRYSICRHSPKDILAPNANSCSVTFKLVGETVRNVYAKKIEKKISVKKQLENRCSLWKKLLWSFSVPIHYYPVLIAVKSLQHFEPQNID